LQYPHQLLADAILIDAAAAGCPARLTHVGAQQDLDAVNAAFGGCDVHDSISSIDGAPVQVRELRLCCDV
jgi:hypothetical protein